MHHRIFGVGDLLLGPALDVKLVRKRAHGFAEFSTGLLDVGLKFVDTDVGTGFRAGPSVVAMAGVLDLFDVESHAVNRLGGGRWYLLHLPTPDERRHERTQEERRGDDDHCRPHRQYQRERRHSRRDQSRGA